MSPISFVRNFLIFEDLQKTLCFQLSAIFKKLVLEIGLKTKGKQVIFLTLPGSVHKSPKPASFSTQFSKAKKM